MTHLRSLLRRQQRQHQQRWISNQHDAVRWSSSTFASPLLRSTRRSCLTMTPTIFTVGLPATKIVVQPLLMMRSYNNSNNNNSNNNNNNNRFLSTTSGSDVQRYLSRETFPLGSIDSQAGEEIVKEIHQQAVKETPESVGLAFELLDRLFEEAIFIRNKNGNDDQPSDVMPYWQQHLFHPSDLVYKVINAWKKQHSISSTSGSNTAVSLSPRDVFERVKRWESGLPDFRSTAYANYMMIHAAVSSQEPELAAEIIGHVIESKGKDNKNNDVVTSNTAIDALSKSSRIDAPQRVEALLKEILRDLHDPKGDGSKNVDRTHRAEKLLHEKTARDLPPSKVPYSLLLLRSKKSHASDRDRHLLKRMSKLIKDEQGIKRYLSLELFPLGSLDSNAGVELIKEIRQLTSKEAITPEDIELAIRLLDRFVDEIIFLQNKKGNVSQRSNFMSWQRFFSGDHTPFSLVFRVVYAWRKNDSNGTASLSPRNMFEKVKHWEKGLPDFHSKYYTYTMSMLSRASALSTDPELAEEILRYLLDGKGQTSVDVMTFNAAIYAWSISGRADSPEKAEKLLREMIDRSAAGWVEVAPDDVSFKSVILAWANSGHENAPQRAEDILHLMESYASSGVKADADTYCLVMFTWVKSNFPDAALRAQSLFDEMQQKYEAGDDTMRPNSDVHWALIMALAKSGHENAPQRAEDILHLMESYASLGVKADADTYCAVMFAWALSDFPDAGIRAQSLFDELQQKYEAGDDTMRPNSHVYVALIHAWVNSGHKDAPHRAEDILRQMESNASLDVKANANAYSAVMFAWVKSDSPDAALQAQSLFDEMQQKYEAGDDTMQPNRNVYVALITTWGRSEHNDRVAKAQAVFDHMMARYESGAKELKPDVKVYTTLIFVLSTAGYPERAEQLIYQMESNEVKPDVLSYLFVWNGWLQSDAPDAFDRMFVLYEDMKRKDVTVDQELKPLSLLFGVLLCAWSRSSSSNRQDNLSKAQVVYEDMVACFDCGEVELAPLVDEYSYLKKTD